MRVKTSSREHSEPYKIWKGRAKTESKDNPIIVDDKNEPIKWGPYQLNLEGVKNKRKRKKERRKEEITEEKKKIINFWIDVLGS